MNNKRRKAITSIIDDLSKVKGQIEEIEAEETEYLENIPENLCDSERAEVASAAVDALASALQAVEECSEALEESVG